MDRPLSFRLPDDGLNWRLIALLKRSAVGHSVDTGGVIHYAPADAGFVENDLIGSIRRGVFPSWQVLTCPEDWTRRYRVYVVQHRIPFQEELSDGALWFLIPRKYRPHAWKLEDRNPAREADVVR